MVENKRCHRIKIKTRLDQIKQTSDEVKSHDASKILNAQFLISTFRRLQENGSFRMESVANLRSKTCPTIF